MRIFDEKLEDLVANAKAVGACKYATNMMSKYSSTEEALTHKFASYWVHWYAVNVLDRRSLKDEELIAMEQHVLKFNPIDIYRYIITFRPNGWEEGKEVLSKSPYCSCFYAIKVMKSRWKEVEPLIKENENLWNDDYAKNFNLPRIKKDKKQ